MERIPEMNRVYLIYNILQVAENLERSFASKGRKGRFAHTFLGCVSEMVKAEKRNESRNRREQSKI